MNKLSYILISVITILILVIGLTVYVKNKPNVNTGSEKPGATYSDFNISLTNSQGQNIAIDNFLKDETVIPDAQNPGLYSLGNTFADSSDFNNSPSYVITYEEKTGYFNVTLLKKPLAQSRQEAEIYLKNFLKINESSMCKLSYMLTVPGYVDVDASGIDYRFSFCSDAVRL